MDRFEFEELIARKFRRAYDELNRLKDKIYATKGVIFVSHVYTQTELLTSPHHAKIAAIVGKISDDVLHWHRNNALPPWAAEEFNNLRDQFEMHFRLVEEEIEARAPTWWEDIRAGFQSFMRFLIGTLPRFVVNFLGYSDTPKLPNRHD